MPALSPINLLSLPDLYRHFAQTGLIRRVLELARDEDLGAADNPERDARPTERAPLHARSSGDLTSDGCIAPNRTARAYVIARGGGVIAGLAAIPDLLSIFAPACKAHMLTQDGDHVRAGACLAVISGALDEILGLERTLLNLIGRLSGIATRTDEFARRIPASSHARLFDTRKTTPGLRVLEKYAVRCGGGYSHRIGLFDAVLIKDNHLAGTTPGTIAAFVAAAAEKARASSTPAFIEVEVDTLDQFDALLMLPPKTIDIILLDNMSCEQMAAANLRRIAQRPVLELEASGGVDLQTIASIALTGVDRISVGALTHSATSLDVALDIAE